MAYYEVNKDLCCSFSFITTFLFFVLKTYTNINNNTNITIINKYISVSLGGAPLVKKKKKVGLPACAFKSDPNLKRFKTF